MREARASRRMRPSPSWSRTTRRGRPWRASLRRAMELVASSSSHGTAPTPSTETRVTASRRRRARAREVTSSSTRRTGQTPEPEADRAEERHRRPSKPTSDFGFKVNGGPTTAFEADGENELSLDPGTYNVTEEPDAGSPTTTDGCNDITLSVPQAKVPVCTITNTAGPEEPLKLIGRKKVVDSDKPASDFSFTVNGQTTPFTPTARTSSRSPPERTR